MAIVLLTKRIEFAAAHRYQNDSWDTAQNRAVFGACNHEHGHGHNYLLEVTIGGEVDEETGMVVNLYDLKQVLEDVLVEFDHKNLNLDTPYFKGVIPTTENIAHVLWRILAGHPEIGQLTRIKLYEDEDLFAEITAEDVASSPASATLTRRYQFSSGHHLRAGHLSQAANDSLFGTCHSPHGHGHDYLLDVAVRGELHPDTGMVTDLAALDRMVQETVITRLHGQDLNRDPLLQGRPPTGEHLARLIWQLLANAVPGGRLACIRLTEGRDQSFEYRNSEAAEPYEASK